MDKNFVPVLSTSLLKRYERPLGLFVLYNVETDTIWAGNESAIDVISLIDGARNVGAVIDIIKKEYTGFSEEEVSESVLGVLASLAEKGMLNVR